MRESEYEIHKNEYNKAGGNMNQVDIDYFWSLCKRNYSEERDDFKLGNTKTLNPNKKKRKCTRCGQFFTSQGPEHRRCAPCHHEVTRSKIRDPKYMIYLENIPKKESKSES